MKRRFAILVVLLLAAPTTAQVEVEPRLVWPTSPPAFQITDNVFDLSDDLGCEWWQENTNWSIARNLAAANQVFTAEVGKRNSKKINTAIAEGKAIGDKYGRYFPVAASSVDSDTKVAYAIKIPRAYGGKIQGKGFVSRGWIPSGHRTTGTSFVCTTDPREFPYSRQGVIRCDGVYWTLGPFNVIGRYINLGNRGNQAVVAGQVAKYGIHFATPPAGNNTIAARFFYLQEGMTFERDSSNSFPDIGFRSVKDCFVVNHIQAVNNRVHKISIGEDCGTVFKLVRGGTLLVDQCVWNKPATLLEIGAPQTGHDNYTIHGIWADAQVAYVDAKPRTRAADLLGRPAMLWRRTDSNNTARVTIRMSGEIAEHPRSWFRDHRFLGQLRGYRNDVILDITGLHPEEAAPFARKDSPQAFPADFASPDSAKGDSFTAPNSEKLVAWWDMSQDAELNSGTVVDGAAITTLGTRGGEDWNLTPSSTAPTILNDGLHHRRAAYIGASGRYLHKVLDGSNPLRDKNELEVHVVAAMENPGADNVERAILTVWKDNARTFEIGMIRATGSDDDRKVFARISRNSTGTDAVTVKSASPLGWDTPALITLRYNGTGSAKAGLAAGEVELVVNGEANHGYNDENRVIRSGGGNFFPPPKNTPLRIGARSSSNNSAAQGMKGRVAEVVVQNQLSTFTLGKDEETGATGNSGELQEWRTYFRNKYGVW